MKILLIVLGIFAGIVWAAPQLVIIGFVFFILPGLFLALAPTAFVYLAVAQLTRTLLGLPRGMLTAVICLGVTLMMSWLAMQPLRARGRANVEAATLPDFVGEQPLEIDGHVRIERPARRRTDRPIDCDPITAALLTTPGVKSVTLVFGDEACRFRLIPAVEAEVDGITPKDPGKIVRLLNVELVEASPHETETVRPAVLNDRRMLADAVDAEWILRLATDERLVVEPANSAESPDWTLRYVREDTTTRNHTKKRRSVITAEAPHVYRWEVLDRNKALQRRTSYVEHQIAPPLFHFAFHGGSSVDGFQVARFRIARQTLEAGQRQLKQDPGAALIALVRIAPPEVRASAPQHLAEAVARVLEQPQGQAFRSAEVELAKRWLASFSFDATEQDLPLIERIIADERIPDVGPALRNCFPSSLEQTPLRNSYVQRLLDKNTSSADRRQYAKQLARLPAGTFREPTANELQLWSDLAIRDDIAPFLARIGDQGEPATEQLLEILTAAAEVEPWNARCRSVTAVRQGLAMVGSDARQAIPFIESLFLRRPSPIMRTSKEATAWRLTLAQLGMPLEDLPFFANQDDATQRKEIDRVRRLLERDAGN